MNVLTIVTRILSQKGQEVLYEKATTFLLRGYYGGIVSFGGGSGMGAGQPLRSYNRQR